MIIAQRRAYGVCNSKGELLWRFCVFQLERLAVGLFVGVDLDGHSGALQSLHRALHLPGGALPAREKVIKDVRDASPICREHCVPQGCDVVAGAGDQAPVLEAVDCVAVHVHAIPRTPLGISSQTLDLDLGELWQEGHRRLRL
jgi:hypothetical protein